MLSILSSALITAYTACDPGMACHGITRSGVPVEEGMVAADWGYHRPGDLICFRAPVSRCFWVTDSGGGIRGPGRFDVYFENRGDAIEFGRVRADYWKPIP